MEEIKNQNQIRSQNPYLIPLSIIIAGLIIAGSIIFVQMNTSEKRSLPDNEDINKDNNEEEEFINYFFSSDVKERIVVSEKDHIRGNFNAPVTIVEYSDFECPFCNVFHPTMKKILQDYPDKVRWVYKHFPLEVIHPQAFPGAEASECVWEQKGNEGFWQFADLLFENQERLGKELYQELAQELNLDTNQFEQCVSSRKYQQKVKEDLQEGDSLGVRGTPASFINGRIIEGALPYEMMKKIIDRVLNENK